MQEGLLWAPGARVAGRTGGGLGVNSQTSPKSTELFLASLLSWLLLTAAHLALDRATRACSQQSRRANLLVGRSATQRPIGKISAECCSFSAVSAPIFARKYAFDSIFQNLPDYHAEIFEIWQNFANFTTFAKFLLNFHKNC